MNGQEHAPAAVYPRERPVPILLEAGWTPGPVWTGAKSCPHYNKKGLQITDHTCDCVHKHTYESMVVCVCVCVRACVRTHTHTHTHTLPYGCYICVTATDSRETAMYTYLKSTCYMNCSWSEQFFVKYAQFNIVSLFSVLIFIQGVQGGKVNILGGHSIGHSKQKCLYEHVSYSKLFPKWSYLNVQPQNCC